ncbi:hypothetical protein ERO13_A01G154550v2 [Gossypium hirsutum]|nr:hypothetical protein ERO13_A01G154550v2 [Gossypium hirsutum]
MAMSDDRSIIAELKARPIFVQQFFYAQKVDNELRAKRAQCDLNADSEFQVDANDCLRFRNRILPSELLQPIVIPEWKWDRVTMDFVSSLPLTPSKKDRVWVIVDRLTKSAHFVPIRTDYLLDKLAELYVIVRLHGVPIYIVSDRDLRFTSRFWKKLQDALGTKLHFSTAFHPQTDGQSE